MIGRELGGRYEILARIGGGGMALVYKAHDILLGRNVAVKVLRQQFVHDEEFIRRFRREAQSAAALSHPNVVSIYDVGQEDDVHYIVMECVEGHNLNEIIQERAPLQTEEAVRIATQICDALEHAHQNHIIHRDIKPHNILIGKNGRVKVTDFGIARAVTSSTITQTGSVIGSVHYFSPEHAKGVSAGEKSDLYSLGIVLYQMLTGNLPFLGESPISVALKHLQETFEEPRAVNPHIPQSVENIILKAMRKNPAERYASAGEMLADLESCLSPERLREPKISFGAGDFDETRVMPAIRSGKEMLARSGGTAATAETGQVWEERSASAKPAKRKWVRPTVIVGLTLLVILLIFAGFRYVQGMLDVPEVDVPYVVGQTETKARQMLIEAGLKVEEPPIHAYKNDVEKGVVFAQSKSNMRVKEGASVRLSVSDGPELKTMGDYAGQSFDDALAALKALGLSEDRIKKSEEYSDKDPGIVIAQSPDSGAQFDPAADTVTLTVSRGPETVEMPNLIGKTEEEAKQAIRLAGLTLKDENIVRAGSYKPQGEVIEQFPYDPGAKAAKGAEVSITVSSGLPKDALEYTFNILISPAQAGKPSKVRITYSDATGENIEGETREISDSQTFPVKVVLAPNTEAMVNVFRDGQLAESFSKTYDDVKDGADSMPQSVPGEEQAPPASTDGGQNGGDPAAEQAEPAQATGQNSNELNTADSNQSKKDSDNGNDNGKKDDD
ncbi:Stk1 family PASTA domain-containing Ser/Thr kinase [Paenibacillus beijingensis]|uniref:Serine/threonine-protein kinase PrkC n=1 Tax=Paenibacillus beijingensis TaxID=1126833 RepID=A0A0D5NN71_9BACL|nr:Stk1 family PASTA domain-containing Ser/Thr kinase [Paenibacillus beijingensis]AJY76462.1 serine/threonine protein kinase [Paenibacillus beijingensis]